MDLMSLLPDFYKENSEMEKLQKIVGADIDNAINDLDKTVEECFINTASFMLSRYEKMHGLKVDESMTDEARREKIKAKIIGIGTFTKQMLINSLKSFVGGSSEIIEEFKDYRFIIKFNDYYRVPSENSITEIYKITDELKPTHLDYDHSYTYDWWINLNDTITWSQATTWDALRTYKEAQN